MIRAGLSPLPNDDVLISPVVLLHALNRHASGVDIRELVGAGSESLRYKINCKI